MTIEYIDISPPSLHRYPLPADTNGRVIPHGYVDCGDPDWCLHDPAPPEDEPGYRLIPIPNAEQPKTFNASQPWVINPDLPAELRRLGYSEAQSNGLGIVFFDKSPHDGSIELAGYQNYSGKLDTVDGETFNYPLTAHIRNGMSPRRTNFVFWHELGHDFLLRESGRHRNSVAAPYFNKDTISRMRRIGGAVLGSVAVAESAAIAYLESDLLQSSLVVAAAAAATGVYSVVKPQNVLHMINKEERRCDSFARKYKDFPALLQAP